MRFIRHAVPLACAMALIACADAAGPVGPPSPSASLSLPTAETEFLPGVPVLDPFAEQLDGGSVTDLARGGGHITYLNARRTFAFIAMNMSDGTTQGQFQINNRAADGVKEHGMVTCLRVLLNTAWIGGIVTHSDGGTEGTALIWQVVDGGEGLSNTADMITVAEPRAAPPADQACQVRPVPVLTNPPVPIDDGNIQVKGGGMLT